MTYPGTKVRKFLNIPNEKYRVAFFDWSPVLFFILRRFPGFRIIGEDSRKRMAAMHLQMGIPEFYLKNPL